MAAAAEQDRIRELEERVAALTDELAGHRDLAAGRVRKIADALPVMLSHIDADECFRFANAAHEDLFGRPLDTIVGAKLSDVLDPDAYARAAPYVRRALAGERVTYEAQFGHGDALRQKLVHYIPRRERGEITGFFAMVQDVSDQWRALQEASESEARFRRIADSAPIPMWVTAADRTREFVNLAYVDFLGVPYAEALTFDWRSILHEDDRDRILEESVRGEASGARFALEARYRRSDGQWRWLRSISHPRFDAAGMPEGFIGVAADVTEAKQQSAAAQGQAEILAKRVNRRTRERDRLWDLSQDPIVLSDREGVWRNASPALAALLGWPPEQLVGRTPEWIEHPDEAASNADMRRRIAAGEILRDFTNRLRGADGAYRCVTWSAATEGETVYCVGRDVTREREQAAALRAAEDALRQAQKMDALGQLTGGVAHDFNNLLTPILGTLDLLPRRIALDDRTGRLLDGALQSAERARTLVQRLLAFARRQPLQPRPVAPCEMIGEMDGLLRSSIGPTIEIEYELDTHVPAALVDQNQVEMALLNLAVNARDAMPDGGTLTITCTTRRVSAGEASDLAPGVYVALRVADTGAGMDDDTLRRAVEPFFSTKAQGAGTGLGLSMVHGLAGQLGGELRIESTVGVGTTVELLLPSTGTVVAREEAAGDTQLPPMRILLVDDDRLVRSSTAAMLADMAHEVIDCESGGEALQLIGDGLEPDVLVTDQVMPGMSGTQLIDAVRRIRPDMKALIISGYPQGAHNRPLAAPRLAKPFRTDELASALSALVGPTGATARTSSPPAM